MRKLALAVVALVVLAAAYWGWALAGAAQIASVASRGDAQAVMQRVDLPALRRSLAGQIARAFLDENPQFRKLLLVEQRFVGSVGAGAANELLNSVLTPETIATLLTQGHVALPGAAGTSWRMPSLTEVFRGGALETLRNSRFDGPLSFVIGVDSAEGRYGVHLHLSGLTWRLSGLDIPDEVSRRLARAIAEKVGMLPPHNPG